MYRSWFGIPAVVATDGEEYIYDDDTWYTGTMISDTRASSKKLMAILLAGVVLVTLLVVVVVVLGAAQRSIDGIVGVTWPVVPLA
ncbi:hypothetical protein SAMN05192561_101292 [Halopenitus malekzadehii]|uniref:Uncharacterized protein n=2 Tax=Halopenitus malekzadehii TaxID=1267564 RepID=A0A1H6HQ57_9EURY|nr:hypothetical protein SAMN05192561_101292 [Halopenitus malekzadehii]